MSNEKFTPISIFFHLLLLLFFPFTERRRNTHPRSILFFIIRSEYSKIGKVRREKETQYTWDFEQTNINLKGEKKLKLLFALHAITIKPFRFSYQVIP